MFDLELNGNTCLYVVERIVDGHRDGTGDYDRNAIEFDIYR